MELFNKYWNFCYCHIAKIKNTVIAKNINKNSVLLWKKVIYCHYCHYCQKNFESFIYIIIVILLYLFYFNLKKNGNNGNNGNIPAKNTIFPVIFYCHFYCHYCQKFVAIFTPPSIKFKAGG